MVKGQKIFGIYNGEKKKFSSDIKVFKNVDFYLYYFFELLLYDKSVFKMLILDQNGILVSGICVIRY